MGGSDIDPKDNYGQTPLSWAARNGHKEVIKLLLEAGENDINSKDKYGQTPLSWAARNGREGVTRLLLVSGNVDVDSKDKYGRAPLSWAAENGYEAVVKLLIATGEVDIESKDKDDRTPLFYAAENGHGAVLSVCNCPRAKNKNLMSSNKIWKDIEILTKPMIDIISLIPTNIALIEKGKAELNGKRRSNDHQVTVKDSTVEIQLLDEKIEEYSEELETIRLAGAKLSASTMINSMFLFPDPSQAYIDFLIKSELSELKRRALMDELRIHKQTVADFTCPQASVITQADIERTIQNLRNLKHFGKMLRNLVTVLSECSALHQ